MAAGGDVKRQVKSIGVTNQRETTVAWDKTTGHPLHPAIVWLDDRTKDVVARLKDSYQAQPGLKEKCGLPISTYFSATKASANDGAFSRFLFSRVMLLHCQIAVLQRFRSSSKKWEGKNMY